MAFMDTRWGRDQSPIRQRQARIAAGNRPGVGKRRAGSRVFVTERRRSTQNLERGRSKLRCPEWLHDFGRWVRDSDLWHSLRSLSLTEKAKLLLKATLGLLLLVLVFKLNLGLPFILISLSLWLYSGPFSIAARAALSALRMRSE